MLERKDKDRTGVVVANTWRVPGFRAGREDGQGDEQGARENISWGPNGNRHCGNR
jgi:hypothetical protein